MEQGTAFTHLRLDVEDRFHRLRAELGVSTFGLNLIVLAPGQRGRIHRHQRQEEVYLVLEGTLELHVEAEPRRLETGELVRVGPDVRRQLVNRSPQRLAVLAIGGARDHEGRDGVAFASWEDSAGVSPGDLPLPEDVPIEG